MSIAVGSSILVVFGSFQRVTVFGLLTKIIRAELTIGFNMAVFGSIRVDLEQCENDVFVCVHACLQEARCERACQVAGFCVNEASFLFFFFKIKKVKCHSGYLLSHGL